MLVADEASLVNGIERVAGQSLVFKTRGIGRPDDVTLLPFYRLHHQRYSVYWRLVSPDAYPPLQAPDRSVGTLK